MAEKLQRTLILPSNYDQVYPMHYGQPLGIRPDGEKFFDEGSKMQVTITVAIKGGIDDWAAYRQYFGNQERIFHTENPAPLHEAISSTYREGDKITQVEAERIFPMMAGEFRWRD